MSAEVSMTIFASAPPPGPIPFTAATIMKTYLHPILAAALLVPAAVQAQGTATLNASGNWNTAGNWTSTPAGFAPVNGSNGQNWNATVNANTVNVDAATIIETLTFSGGTIQGSNTLTANAVSTWAGGTFGNGTAGGITNLNGGVTISANGQILDMHTLNLSSSSSIGAGTLILQNGSTLSNSGTFDIANATSLTFNGLFSGESLVLNTGAINKTGGGNTAFVNGVTLSNTGIVNVTNGSFSAFDVLQYSDGNLTGGTWNVSSGGNITFINGVNLTTIGSDASLMLDGATSAFARLGSVIASTLTTNQGNFTLKNNRDITTASAFTNSGVVTVQDGTTAFKIGSGGSAAYTQTTGETVLVGGALIDASVFNLDGGELKGTGAVASSVITSGSTTIAPGQSPGMLTIDGNLTLSAGNTLAMEIGGLTQGTLYDYLDVNGTLTLAGLLDLDFLNGFESMVQYGDIFTLATADSAILGAFSNVVSGSRLWTNTDKSFEVWYGAGSLYGENNLVITGAPEPTRAMLMLLGFTGLMLRRRRQQRQQLEQPQPLILHPHLRHPMHPHSTQHQSLPSFLLAVAAALLTGFFIATALAFLLGSPVSFIGSGHS